MRYTSSLRSIDSLQSFAVRMGVSRLPKLQSQGSFCTALTLRVSVPVLSVARRVSYSSVRIGEETRGFQITELARIKLDNQYIT